MSKSMIIIPIFLLAALTLVYADYYSGGGYSGPSGSYGSGYGGGYGGGYGAGPSYGGSNYGRKRREVPQQQQTIPQQQQPSQFQPVRGPKKFSINVADGILGANQLRKENWDNGTVTGLYANPLGNNKYQIINYIADDKGYRILSTKIVDQSELALLGQAGKFSPQTGKAQIDVTNDDITSSWTVTPDQINQQKQKTQPEGRSVDHDSDDDHDKDSHKQGKRFAEMGMGGNMGGSHMGSGHMMGKRGADMGMGHMGGSHMGSGHMMGKRGMMGSGGMGMGHGGQMGGHGMMGKRSTDSKDQKDKKEKTSKDDSDKDKNNKQG